MTTFNTIEKPKINFTMVPNEVLIDKRLSLKAKGLWVYFLSRPDGWKFSVDRLCKTMLEGKKAIQSAIKELEDADYLKKRARYDGDSKKLSGYQYTLQFDASANQKVADTKGVHHESCPPENGVPINKKDTNKTDVTNTDSKVSVDDPKGSSPQKKEDQIISDSEQKKSVVNSYYKLAVDEYFKFFEEKSQAKPKFGAGDGIAMKSILGYFRSIAPEGTTSLQAKAEYSLSCLQAIFKNWNKLTAWQQKNPDIKIINSQLNNIITNLRTNGNAQSIPNSKTPRQSTDWVE